MPIYTTQWFITKATAIHKRKYAYDKTVYVRSHDKIIIICPIHGEFKQTPTNHLTGYGCERCAIELKRLSNADFISKANLIHNFKYDYSKSENVAKKGKIAIVCPIHGEFKQTLNSHLARKGCKLCSESKGEKIIRGFLTRRLIKFESQYKMPECKKNLPLPFDFGIFKENKLVGLIEYQGKQHYEIIDVWGGEQELSETKRRDGIKNNFCKDHNIPLLIISFLEFKKAEEMVEKFLEKIGLKEVYGEIK